MLPVTISLGLINFNLLINSFFGSLVSDRGPAAIDKAFRIYQLPQGIFSVAIATVLFPTLARFAARGATRRPAGDDGERDAPDHLRPDSRGGGDPGPLGADDPARLRARRVRCLADRAGRGGAVLVRLLAADQRPLPAADAHLLQPPAALAADRDRGREPGADCPRIVGPLRAIRGRRDRRRDGDRNRGERRRPMRDPAPRARRPRAGPAAGRDGSRRRRLAGAGGGQPTASGSFSTTPSGARWAVSSPPCRLRSASAGSSIWAPPGCCGCAELEQIMRLLRRRG